MKERSRFWVLVSLIAILMSCAHQKKQLTLSDLTPKELDELNQEALLIVSKKLELMVAQAKSSESATQFLASDLFLKANMSLLQGDYATSSVLFKHLVHLVPSDSFLQKKYAISLIRTGEMSEASIVLEKLYASTGDEKMGLILAGVYAGMDRDQHAKKMYERLLSRNAQNEDACIFLSKILVIEKQTEHALKQLNKCAKMAPHNGSFDYHIGKIYLEQGKIPKALMSFKAAIQKQSDLGEAANSLGLLLEEKEDYDSAIVVYKKFLEKQPSDSIILSRLVHVLFLKERFLEVIPYAERLADLRPDNLNLKVKLGILYTDAKKYSEAISVFKDLLQFAPQSDKILYYLGAIYQEMNQYQSSIEFFNQIQPSSALYTDSSVQMANMLSSLAQVEFVENQSGINVKRFLNLVDRKIKEIEEMKVEFSVIKAGFYEGTGQFKYALECLQSVKDEKNFSNQHKYYLASLYEKEKRYDESASLIMSIIEKEPKNAHAWNFLAYSLIDRGENLDLAFEYIQKALKIDPNDGYIRDTLGWYYFQTGQISKALIEIEFANKKIPEDVEILKHLAVIHKQLKNYQLAKKFYETALKHVRYKIEKKEIILKMEELEKDRLPASDNKP